MAALGEFDLLRDSRTDVRQLPWANPAHRRATNMYYNVKRAHEEIKRLNIEIPRLFTAMLDEHYDYHRAIAANIVVNPPLAYELSRQWVFRDRINGRVASHLATTSRLPGFSGTVAAGQRVGKAACNVHDVPLPTWACLDRTALQAITEEDVLLEGLSTVYGVASEEEADGLVEFFDNLGLATDGDE